jgi:hypothetical protein
VLGHPVDAGTGETVSGELRASRGQDLVAELGLCSHR